MRVAEMLGREDLIQDRSPAKSGHYQAVDAESLLNVPPTSATTSYLVLTWLIGSLLRSKKYRCRRLRRSG
jgi:hypothetical protein